MKTKGFTLVELLVVIAILAILATVSVVGYTSFIENANNSACEQELAQIKTQVIANDITGTYADKYTVSSNSFVWTADEGDVEADAEADVAAAIKAMVPELDFGTEGATLTVEGTLAEGKLTVTKITYARDGGSATWTIGQ